MSVTREQLDTLLRQSDFKSFATSLMSLLAPSIRIGTRRAAPTLGQSRFGGEPDLPADVEWPRDGERPMEFLCQINFAEASRVDQTGALPTDGHLYLFYSMDRAVWGFDPADRSGWCVRFVEGSRPLVRRPTPPDVPAENRFPESVLSFELEWMLPARDLQEFPPDLNSLLHGDDQKYDQFNELFNAPEFQINQHRLLGYPQPVQSDMRLECQLVSHGLYCGDLSSREDPRFPALEAGAADWRLLLQIDTDDTDGEGPGWMWGDCGRIYLLIRNDDLKEREFERAWLVLQCC